MVALAQLIHFFSIVFCTVATAYGVSRSHGKTAAASFEAIERQPAMQGEITGATILALALIETAAILGFLMSFFLFFKPPTTFPSALGELGIAFSMGIPGLVIGWASADPASNALGAIARQPFVSRRMRNFMLLVLSLLQTPLIFGLIMAFVIHGMLPGITTVAQSLILIGAGIAIGLGSVGPVLGSCLFTKIACKSAGRNRAAFSKLFTFTFISQAMIETPVVFAIIISLMLINQASIVYENPLIGLAYLAFGATMGIGTFGTGISSGRAAAAAADQIAYNPAAYTILSRASMMAQGLIDTIAIYAFIISIWLVLTPLAS